MIATNPIFEELPGRPMLEDSPAYHDFDAHLRSEIDLEIAEIRAMSQGE